MAAKCAVVGLGYHLPEKILSHGDVAKITGNWSEAELNVGGIEKRCFAADGLGASDLGFEAARVALQDAGLSPGEVEFIIFATMSPDFVFPGGGCLLQEKLGCRTIGALDVRAQCTGFLQGLLIAEQFLRTAAYRNVLVVGSEVLSSYLEPGRSPLEVAGCFGDGAGAVVLAAAEANRRVPLTVVTHTDASRLEEFWCEFPASRNFPQRVTPEHLRAGLHLPRVNRKGVLEMARRRLPEAIEEVLAQAGARPRDVAKLFVQVLDASQAEAIGVTSGFAAKQVVPVGEKTGTVGAAALPVALGLQVAGGGVARGDLVCLASLGAGINWGAALFEL